MASRKNNQAFSGMSRRSFLQISGVGAAALLANRLPQLSTSHADATPVVFWTPGGAVEFCANFDTIAQDFKKLNPGIDVQKTQCGTGQENFNEVLLARVAAGNPPDATILWSSPVSWAARGTLVALDSMMAASEYSKLENWPAALLASCQWKGKTYGLPATAGSWAIMFNKTVFEEKGIKLTRETFPKTWDELKKLSKEVTTWKGDTLEKVGFMPIVGDIQELPIWSGLNGGMLYDAANTKYTIDSPQNIEMMEYAVKWLDEEYKGNMALVVKSGNWKPGTIKGAEPAHWTGKQGALADGSWNMGVKQHLDPTVNFDYAPFPVGPSGSKSVSGFWPNWAAIPQNAQHQAEAFKWLDYVSGVGVVPWFQQFADLPVNLAVKGKLVVPAVEKAKGEAFAADLVKFFQDQFTKSVPMWTSPVEDFAYDQLQTAYDKIMNKVAKPKDALAEAQKACQAELESTLKA